MIGNHSSSSFSSASFHPTDEVTIEQVSRGCCESMALSDIFPIFIVAGALWILVYCILMTQKIFMDTQYQEIQPKPHGEEDEEEHHGNNHVDSHPNVEKENHKHDHNERTFFAYYL
uniref:Uncharacterized protein n=1 Tax=Caenorhabditis tropicalis TaxID=1561998 RepID=A0A1I7V4C8_9PELO